MKVNANMFEQVHIPSVIARANVLLDCMLKQLQLELYVAVELCDKGIVKAKEDGDVWEGTAYTLAQTELRERCIRMEDKHIPSHGYKNGGFEWAADTPNNEPPQELLISREDLSIRADEIIAGCEKLGLSNEEAEQVCRAQAVAYLADADHHEAASRMIANVEFYERAMRAKEVK